MKWWDYVGLMFHFRGSFYKRRMHFLQRTWVLYKMVALTSPGKCKYSLAP